MSLILKTFIEYDRFYSVDLFSGGQSCWDLSHDFYMSETFSREFLRDVLGLNESGHCFFLNGNSSVCPFVGSGPLKSELDDDLFVENRVGWMTGDSFLGKAVRFAQSAKMGAGDQMMSNVIHALATVIPAVNIRLTVLIH